MILGTKHFRKETSRNQESWLVGGIPTPLKNMSSSVGMIIPKYSQYMESHKNVPNHQSDIIWFMDAFGTYNIL